MKKVLLLAIIFSATGFVFLFKDFFLEPFVVLNRVYGESLSANTEQNNEEVEFENIDSGFSYEDIERRFPDLSDWQRPDGPPRVGLQVGHWKARELPDELQRLRERGGGTSGGGKAEWEVNLVIAEGAAALLRAQGIVVDILPATIPKAYWADVFIAIHADGNINPSVSGFKVASAYACFPLFHSGEWRGRQGSNHGQWSFRLNNNCPQSTEAIRLVELLEVEYQQATKIDIDQNVSHNMRGYYAFNWRRYEHAVHPMTTAVILETGFLTSPNDRAILIDNSDKAVEGIVNAITQFLKEKNFL